MQRCFGCLRLQCVCVCVLKRRLTLPCLQSTLTSSACGNHSHDRRAAAPISFFFFFLGSRLSLVSAHSLQAERLSGRLVDKPFWKESKRSHFSILFANVHAQIASVYGHHGHEEYGGSYFHYLHHSKVWCNYGTPFLPLDILMGTWETGHPKANK
uniref:Uncharacterized protein n=1 Tax=Lotharella oceanica TaxID=641309 RepID=A0A7S2TL02_9EUKA